MSGLNLEVRGLEKLGRKFSHPSAALSKPLGRLLEQVGTWLQDRTREQVPVDTGRARDSVVFAVDSASVPQWATVTSDLDYMTALEEGSRPHWPPLEAVQPWARRHGFPEGRRGAFLVARSIARRGTPARHLFQRAQVAVTPELGRRCKEAAQEIVRRLNQ